jgi:hypothetical protein
LQHPYRQSKKYNKTHLKAVNEHFADKYKQEEYFKNCGEFYKGYMSITRLQNKGYMGCPICKGTTLNVLDDFCYCQGVKKELVNLKSEWVPDPWKKHNKKIQILYREL